ncbi:unnamed protein product [Meloidogyne enterolobii]|uniref:Uncharacterized protein n=1 Tax=Meloidogyne enterolobii TaxID=390850 RepID=A0ACB0XT22_MELEN
MTNTTGTLHLPWRKNPFGRVSSRVGKFRRFVCPEKSLNHTITYRSTRLLTPLQAHMLLRFS